MKRLRKLREKEKHSIEKCLASGDGVISSEENISEVSLEVEEENDMSLAVKESMQMTCGKFEEKAVEQFMRVNPGIECSACREHYVCGYSELLVLSHIFVSWRM